MAQGKLSQQATRLIKFSLVGVSNTVVTFLTFQLLRCFDVNLLLSNIIGYIAGVANSFIWNRTWVFASQVPQWKQQLIIFVVGALLCWFIQWLCFEALLQHTTETLAQLIGMVVYTLLNFAYNQVFTFRERKK